MEEIYLDHCATTPVDEDIAAVAVELMREAYGNPSSLHSKGLSAQLRLDKARLQLAAALGCSQEEVVFTSGGTESNNLALLGGAAALGRRGKTIVAMAYEHSSVLEPLRHLERQGCTLRLVNPAPDGRVDAGRLVDAVDGDTILVSCMLVNSEVGTVAPVAEIARAVRRKNSLALIHCDAAQAFGKLPFSADKLGVDTLSVSGHKIHAPKGCGALYLRKGTRLSPLLHGGGQERGLRPGTENLPAACAFGYAAEKMTARIEENLFHVRSIREYFVNKAKSVPGLCINSPGDATPYLCNVSLPGYRSEILLHYLAQRGVYVSSGSACSRGAASHVLRSMGLPPERVDSALRVSFGKDTRTEHIDAFFETLKEAAREVLPARRRKLRKASGGV